MALAAHLPAGSLFAGDFRVLELIAEGGMGAVYRVEQRSTHKQRALKLVHARLADDPKSRQRFVREATVGASIESEHVVEVIGAGVDEDTDQPWLAMELLEGADLETLVEHRGPLQPAQWHAVMRQLCHGLAAAHRAGVVHRDLKPANVFVAQSRRLGEPFTVKILDFGIAKVLERGRASSTETATIGSPLWMAPEQLDAQRATTRTDLWALGLIAFWALTGAPYWRAANQDESNVQALFVEQLFKPIEPPSERARELQTDAMVPDGFDAWFLRAVARDPAERFADAEEALAEYERLVARPSNEPLADLLPSPLPRRRADELAPTPYGPTAAQSEIDTQAVQVSEPGTVAVTQTRAYPEGFVPSSDTPPPVARRVWALALGGAIVAGVATWLLVSPPWRGATVAIALPVLPAPVVSPPPEAPPEVPPTVDPTRRPPKPPPLPPPPVRDPEVELVVPLRTQLDREADRIEMLGWTPDAGRFALRVSYLDEADEADPDSNVLNLVQVHDALTGAMIESFDLERASRLRPRYHGKLRRASEEARTREDWGAREVELALVGATADRDVPGRGAFDLEADEAGVPTRIDVSPNAEGFRFTWSGIVQPPPADVRSRGPKLHVFSGSGDDRWELLEVRPPFAYEDVAALSPLGGEASVLGRIEAFVAPDQRRVLFVVTGHTEPAPATGSMQQSRWFLRGIGPGIRIVEAGAGQRAARLVARELQAAGLPTTALDLREPASSTSRILHGRGPGDLAVAERVAAALGTPPPIDADERSVDFVVTIVLGHDAAR